MSEPVSNQSLVTGKLILVQLFWAGTFVASEIALQTEPPAFTAVVRFVVTTSCYCGLLGLMNCRGSAATLPRLRRVTRRGWFVLAGMGFSGVFMYTLLLHAGLERTTAAYAALLIPTTQPIFTAALSRIVFRDPISAGTLAGLILGLAGASLVISQGAGSMSLLSANVTIIASAFAFSCYAVCSKLSPVELTSIETTTVSFLFGTLFLLPMPFVFREAIDITAATPRFWLSILYLVIFATLLPYLWWNEAVRAIGSAKTGVFTFLMPPLAVVLAAAVLGHAATTQQIVGGVLALAGVAFATTELPFRRRVTFQ